MSATPKEREQAWADLKTALTEAVVPVLEAVVRFLTRVIDRLSPRPAERSLALVGAEIGRTLDGFSRWVNANSQIIGWAVEVQKWEAQARALGMEDGTVERMVEDACQYAAERGLDPMTVARDRWERLTRTVAMGQSNPYLSGEPWTIL